MHKNQQQKHYQAQGETKKQREKRKNKYFKLNKKVFLHFLLIEEDSSKFETGTINTNRPLSSVNKLLKDIMNNPNLDHSGDHIIIDKWTKRLNMDYWYIWIPLKYYKSIRI